MEDDPMVICVMSVRPSITPPAVRRATLARDMQSMTFIAIHIVMTVATALTYITNLHPAVTLEGEWMQMFAVVRNFRHSHRRQPSLV